VFLDEEELASGSVTAIQQHSLLAESPVAQLQHLIVREIPGAWFYQEYAALGVDYGGAFRSIARAWELKQGDVLAELNNPVETSDVDTGAVDVEAALFDSALQSCLALFTEHEQLLLPFALQRVEFHRELESPLFAHCKDQGGERLQKVDIDIYTTGGELCVSLEGLSSRRLSAAPEPAEESAELSLYQPVWVTQPVLADAAEGELQVAEGAHGVTHWLVQVGGDDRSYGELLRSGVASRWLKTLEADVGDRYTELSLRLLEFLQELGSMSGSRHHVQLLVDAGEEGTLLSGLSGMLSSAGHEHAWLSWQLIQVDLLSAELLDRLKEDRVNAARREQGMIGCCGMIEDV